MSNKTRLDKLRHALSVEPITYSPDELAQAGLEYAALIEGTRTRRTHSTPQAAPEDIAAAASKYFKLLKPNW